MESSVEQPPGNSLSQGESALHPRLTYVFADLYRQRALVWAFANRDFATRYRSSILGWAWSLLQPLATLLVYAAVFSLVVRIQAPPLGADPERTSFAAFLFTGMVTFNLFSGLLIQALLTS